MLRVMSAAAGEQRSLCSLCRASPSALFVRLFPLCQLRCHATLRVAAAARCVCWLSVCIVHSGLATPTGLLAAEGCGPGSAEGGTHAVCVIRNKSGSRLGASRRDFQGATPRAQLVPPQQMHSIAQVGLEHSDFPTPPSEAQEEGAQRLNSSSSVHRVCAVVHMRALVWLGFKKKVALGRWLAEYPVWLRRVDPCRVAYCKCVRFTPVLVGWCTVRAVGLISYP
jgi:hypothetical protein